MRMRHTVNRLGWTNQPRSVHGRLATTPLLASSHGSEGYRFAILPVWCPARAINEIRFFFLRNASNWRCRLDTAPNSVLFQWTRLIAVSSSTAGSLMLGGQNVD